MKTILSSLRLLLLCTLLLGFLYPAAVWAVSHLFWRDAAEGSLLQRGHRLVGSALLAQKTTDPRYFWPRPSAGDYATVASGAGNQAWTNAKLIADVDERAKPYGAEAPSDLLTGSGSGLDPDLSPEAVRLQAGRVAAARRLDADQRHALDDLIARQVEGGQISPARINVLQLNLALDASWPGQ